MNTFLNLKIKVGFYNGIFQAYKHREFDYEHLCIYHLNLSNLNIYYVVSNKNPHMPKCTANQLKESEYSFRSHSPVNVNLGLLSPCLFLYMIAMHIWVQQQYLI